MGVFLVVVLIGFIAGILARFIVPGPNRPRGFLLTTIIGIAGAFLATLVGEGIGFYSPGQGAGLIGATIGAVVVLFVWKRLVEAEWIRDHGI